MDFKWVADHFHQLQFVFLGIILAVIWLNARGREDKSGFRTREADRSDLNSIHRNGPSLADAKLKKRNPQSAPLSLPGIRLDGEPHEILGVDESADESEIMRAYKDKIKMFHPDRIQGQAREQIKFYEEASAKINLAKEAMIEQIRKK